MKIYTTDENDILTGHYTPQIAPHAVMSLVSKGLEWAQAQAEVEQRATDDDPTVFLMPENPILDAPPECSEFELVRRINGAWVVEVNEATRPSPLHDFDLKKKVWVENSERAAALAAEQAKAQATAAIEAVRTALQAAIDARARSMDFSSGNALMLYASAPNAFQKLALQFLSWEAQVWTEAGAYKNEVLAGTKPMLSPAEAVAMMPAYPEESTNELTE